MWKFENEMGLLYRFVKTDVGWMILKPSDQ